jgi:hypothetical protein
LKASLLSQHVCIHWSCFPPYWILLLFSLITYAPSCKLADAATSKKRHAPKAGEERPSKRLLSGRAPVTSFHSSPSSSSSSSTAPTHWASTPRTGDYFASTAEENKAVASFQARNEITTRKLLSVLNSRSRLWATHEWFYSGVSFYNLRLV